ncbi:MAG TPA: orotidine-5'-phosphate decarboxylase [Candidatus Omnitrophota bacterium]|nr:orotidine-5'-phosphate decarboxylase [Candidatus Omnitrophota bacterium]
MQDRKQQLIVALDVPSFEEARQLIDKLKEDVDIFKVGSQLFTACGPVVVRYIAAMGKKVFLDLKYHDIPNTVASAVERAVALNQQTHTVNNELYDPKEHGIFMLTVHILGGKEMLKAAKEAALKQSKELGVLNPKIVGITVLTSDASTTNVLDIVLERARLAKESGLDGIVASSQEAAILRQEFGKDFIIVTPGIRPLGEKSQDQKRVTTPSEAIKNGSSFLVIGRPIVCATNPLNAAKEILKEMNNI